MSAFRKKIYNSITETIGATPLVRLHNIEKLHNVEANLIAKLEFFNPLASVKDRIGVAMVEAAEEAGDITPGKTTLVEATSGNTGIALAYVAAAKGYKLILTMPESMSIERRKMLKFLGANLELTPAHKGMTGAIDRAKEIVEGTPDTYMIKQFDNPANPDIHASTTALEIWEDTNGNVDVIISGVGTGGTLTGISRVLKEKNKSLKVIAVEPEESPILSGGSPAPHKIQGIGAGFIPSILETDYIDDIVKVKSETAFETTRELALTEGIPTGISSGAALAAALEIAKRPEYKGKNIVIIFPDFAERYLSTALFDFDS
ncbi:MAG: cysteine synthase A [Zetaproteobacteria bacterium]|nr:MAG: cysteine synthase A [Zetaproteobacteria bacterium]